MKDEEEKEVKRIQQKVKETLTIIVTVIFIVASHVIGGHVNNRTKQSKHKRKKILCL